MPGLPESLLALGRDVADVGPWPMTVRTIVVEVDVEAGVQTVRIDLG